MRYSIDFKLMGMLLSEQIWKLAYELLTFERFCTFSNLDLQINT